MDKLGGKEDGILGMDFFYIFDCAMIFRKGKLTLEDNTVVVWCNSELNVKGARLASNVLCRPKTYTEIPLRVPADVDKTWTFKPSSAVCMNMSLGGDNGVINREQPSVWMWNNSSSAIGVKRNEGAFLYLTP